MNILITGPASGLGQALIPRLIQKDRFTVRVLVHRTKTGFPDCQVVQGDLLDKESLDRATRGMDMVVHLAALTQSLSREDYFNVNVEGTRNLIGACSRNGVERFLHISSRAAQPHGGAYAESKLAAEQCVRDSGLSWLILRPSEIYGARSRDAINRLVGWVQRWRVIPVIGNGNYFLSPVHIDDAVHEIACALERSEFNGETFLIAGPEEIPLTEAIDRICRHLQVRRTKIYIPAGLIHAAVVILARIKPGILVPDQVPRLLCEKNSGPDYSSQIPGFQPMTLEEGLSRFLF